MGKEIYPHKSDTKFRSCFELFEMFFEVKNLQTNNSKQLLSSTYFLTLTKIRTVL